MFVSSRENVASLVSLYRIIIYYFVVIGDSAGLHDCDKEHVEYATRL